MHSDVSALELILTGDPALLAIVRLSLMVSLSAVAISSLIGIPLGAFVALNRFWGREGVIVLLNALMGLPPVVAGLAVYLLLRAPGRLARCGLLFTPTAMVIAQTVLVMPIIAALARQTIEDLVEGISRRAERHECRTLRPGGDIGLGWAFQSRGHAACRVRTGGGRRWAPLSLSAATSMGTRAR